MVLIDLNTLVQFTQKKMNQNATKMQSFYFYTRALLKFSYLYSGFVLQF